MITHGACPSIIIIFCHHHALILFVLLVSVIMRTTVTFQYPGEVDVQASFLFPRVMQFLLTIGASLAQGVVSVALQGVIISLPQSFRGLVPYGLFAPFMELLVVASGDWARQREWRQDLRCTFSSTEFMHCAVAIGYMDLLTEVAREHNLVLLSYEAMVHYGPASAVVNRLLETIHRQIGVRPVLLRQALEEADQLPGGRLHDMHQLVDEALRERDQFWSEHNQAYCVLCCRALPCPSPVTGPYCTVQELPHCNHLVHVTCFETGAFDLLLGCPCHTETWEQHYTAPSEPANSGTDLGTSDHGSDAGDGTDLETGVGMEVAANQDIEAVHEPLAAGDDVSRAA
jgi:hypothetical protein